MKFITQADFGVAITLFVITAGFYLHARLGPIRRERRKHDRYALFAIRDRLVRLVAEGKIDQRDDVFEFLYGGVNRLIPQVKPITLQAVVTALVKSRLLETQVLEPFLAALNHQNAEVRATAHDLFRTLDKILMARSLFVSVSSQLGHPGQGLPNWLQHAVAKLWPTRYRALMLYLAVQHTTGRLLAEA